MKIDNSRVNKGHTVIAITASKTWIVLQVQTINLIIFMVDVVENSIFLTKGKTKVCRPSIKKQSQILMVKEVWM